MLSMMQCPLSELLEEASNNANMDLANEDNLQKIAWHVAECRWKETRWDDEEPLNAPKLFSSDAIDTGDSAIGEVDEFAEWAERILRLLPEVLPIEGTGYLGRAERVEKLNEGERLVVAGDWNNDNFGSVCLEVFNDRDKTLGNLSIREDSEYASMLARVLPHLIAFVEKMTPVSKRRKGSKYPLLDVRLELAPGITHDQFVTACKNNKDIDRSREVLFSSGTKLGKSLGDKPFGQKAARNETGLSAARAGFVKRARKRGHLVTLPGIKRLRRHGEHARVAHQQVCEDHHLHRQSFLLRGRFSAARPTGDLNHSFTKQLIYGFGVVFGLLLVHPRRKRANARPRGLLERHAEVSPGRLVDLNGTVRKPSEL